MRTYLVKAKRPGNRALIEAGRYVGQSPLGALLQAGRLLAARGQTDITELRAEVVGPARLRANAPRPGGADGPGGRAP